MTAMPIRSLRATFSPVGWVAGPAASVLGTSAPLAMVVAANPAAAAISVCSRNDRRVTSDMNGSPKKPVRTRATRRPRSACLTVLRQDRVDNDYAPERGMLPRGAKTGKRNPDARHAWGGELNRRGTALERAGESPAEPKLRRRPRLGRSLALPFSHSSRY